MKNIAMIPARLGSQRLKRKNLHPFLGTTLIEHAIERCKRANCFDEIWVNSESEIFGEIANKNKVYFHLRPEQLGDSVSTSEEFVYEFLCKVNCSNLFQVHSIAPLLGHKEISKFVKYFNEDNFDTLLSYIPDQIEVAYQNSPVNFSFTQKSNSQDLKPVQRVTWSITGWKSKSFLNRKREKGLGTYSGRVGFHPVDPISGHVIKTLKDLKIAEAMASTGE